MKNYREVKHIKKENVLVSVSCDVCNKNMCQDDKYIEINIYHIYEDCSNFGVVCPNLKCFNEYVKEYFFESELFDYLTLNVSTKYFKKPVIKS